MGIESERTICKTQVLWRNILFWCLIIIIGMYSVYQGYDPASPKAPRPFIVILGGAAMLIISSLSYELTTKQLIISLGPIPLRRYYPEDIYQIAFVSETGSQLKGVLFVAYGCERFDRNLCSAAAFQRKHPLSCVTIFTKPEHIGEMCDLIEENWGTIDGKYLL